MQWMIYGANGYTGELIAREAHARGLQPVLAGRSAQRIKPLAAELGLPHLAFDLADAAAAARAVQGHALVLNCAGPFSATAAPMIEACLAARAHYLDITGEIDVFEHAHAQDARAKAAGIVVCPGVGFDVIPTDCVAAALKQALPDATHLALGFDTDSGLSAGTAKTSVEGLGLGGRARVDGRIEKVPLAWHVRRIDYGRGLKTAMSIPWGDVSTAWYSTRIPNIEVFVPAPGALITGARLANGLLWLLGSPPVQKLLKRQAAKVQGPDAAARERMPTHVWGQARNAAGTVRTARLQTANGYALTITGSLAVVAGLLERSAEGGAYTPSLLFGPQLVERLPGSGAIRVE
ncbi:MAG: hypothetical protein EPO12_18690 [Aquabacterium sp.]|jgi:short subunit dehydrogenase-like uncharacterized protein|nr:MAG: hypothetical protein EPO12_18690 [Aquabacterium sp.]